MMTLKNRLKNYCPAIVFLFLVFLSGPSLSFSQEPPAPEQQIQMLYQLALGALQAGEPDKALLVADKIREINPAEEGSYRLSVMANWMKRDFGSIVAAVQIAKMNGVESIFLYKYMTQALYFLSGFSSTIQGFKRMEDMALEHMKQGN